MSDRKSRQMLRRVKEKNKNAVLVVTGCYAQVAQSELEKIDDIDIVLGNTKKGDIVKYVEDYISKNKCENLINMFYHLQAMGLVKITTEPFIESENLVVEISDSQEIANILARRM